MLEKVFLFVTGSIVGSFLNVCIYRLPKDLSIVKPRSFCPNCKETVRWYDNIPVLSFFTLRGKCRRCGAKISARYPLVESITGLLFIILYAKFGASVDFFKYFFFFSLLIVVSFIDIDYHAIPVYLCFIGICVGLLFSILDTARVLKNGIFEPWNLPAVVAIRALVFGFGFTYLFKFFGDTGIGLYLSLRKKESIEGEKESLGLGDVDFMGMVAVFLGLESAVLVFFFAPFFALLYAVFAIVFKRSHLIPYLPYLSLAVVAIFFWKDHILRILGLTF